MRWPVAVEASQLARAAVEATIAELPTLRPAGRDELGVIATVRIENDAVTIEDAGGPLCPPAAFPAQLDGIVAHLANLGVAQGLRELEGEHGVLASELAVELGTVHDGQTRRLPDHGGVLGLSDRYYLKLERRGHRPLFVHVLNISARGKLTMLTYFARGGVVLDRHCAAVSIGQHSSGVVTGVGLRWPEGMTRNGLPRLTEYMVIATLGVTDLSGLETRELAVKRDGGSPLQRVLAQLCNGAYRGTGSAGPLDGFLVKRCSVLLDPGPPPEAEPAPGQRTDRRSSL
jgi:hypothetical protein